MTEQGNPVERDMINLTRDWERMKRENGLMQPQLEDLRLKKNRTVDNRSTLLSINSGSLSTPRPTITALRELLSEFTGAENIFWN